MASPSLLSCLGCGRSIIFSSSQKETTSSLFSCQRSKLPSNVVTFRRASRRNAVFSSLLIYETELWTSVQQELKSHWFLLSPFIFAPVLASSSESRQLLVAISDATRAVVSNLGLLLLLQSRQWQRLQRGVVQLSALLIMVNAFHSDIPAPDPYDTLENVPQDISGGEIRKRIQHPKSQKAERCTQKCVGTCVRGGAGSPGEGPFNIRKPLVVFKEGFRTRQYCLIECSDICNLIGDGDDGP